MKKGILSLIVLLLITFMAGCSTFNDVKSMEAKIAKELDIERVSIFDSQDIDEYRFVGYTFENKYGFAAFKQNGNRGYVFDYVKKTDKMMFRAKDIANDMYASYWIVVSNNENLNTIQFEIKDKSDSNDEIITLEVTDCPSISVIKLPYEEHFESVEYNFYDDKGNLIQ